MVSLETVIKCEKTTSFGTTWLALTCESTELVFLLSATSCLQVEAILKSFRDQATQKNLLLSENLMTPDRNQVPEVQQGQNFLFLVCLFFDSCSEDLSLVPPSRIVEDNDPSQFRLPFGESLLECVDARFFGPDGKYLFGRLFVLTNFVCFNSNDDALRFVVPLCAIAFALSAKTFLVLPNALKLITNVSSFFFVLAKRDAVLNCITKQIQACKRVEVNPFPVVTSRTLWNERRENLMSQTLTSSYFAKFGEGASMIHSISALRSLCQSGLPSR